MNLSEEILFISLPENLKCIPNVYKEMFKGFDLLRDDIEFDLSTENVYDQPLFCNPNVLFDGKTVIWYDFINAGIVQVKDICYEVIEGFLPEMAIVEMIQNVTNHCDINSIVKRYNTLKVVLPKEWTEIIHKNIHRRNVSRSININVIFKDKLSEFSMCSTKELYLLLTSKLCQHPICYKKWTEVFEIEENDLFVSVVNADHYIRYAELHSNDFPEHGLDEGWLTINVSSNWIIQLYALNDECWKCPFVHVTTIPDTASQVTVPVNTTFGTTIVLKRKHPGKDIEEDFCRFHQKFREGGNYWVFIDFETYKSEECEVLLINHPLPAEMRTKARKSSSLDVTEPSTKSKKDLKLSSHHTKSQSQDNGQTTEVTIQPEESSSTKDHKRTRLKSLDTFRGYVTYSPRWL
ncbi:unnamed protein product [Mytilus edulis]|uniref:Uncharacterized protein n=1 Tax=Mytilus edulis TaxID=6550 RepID=A0A8S3UD54_MYTED|nr:unnamed protein product [Mytilus edulis]